MLKEGESNEVADCYVYIGLNYTNMGNTDKAIEALKASLKIKTKLYG